MANEITKPSNQYLDLNGLSLFWQNAKEYIISQKSIVEADHTPVTPTVPEGSPEGTTVDVNWTPKDNAWITVTSSSDAVSGTTTYKVCDGAIQAKMDLVEQEMAVIKANAGVTGVKVVDGAGDLIKFTVTNALPTGATDGQDGMKRGDITIAVDESELNTFATTTNTNISAVDDARKDDIATIYGEDYTAAGDTLGVSGSFKTDSGLSKEEAYNTLTKINNRLQVIDTNLVTTVAEGSSVENYVTLDVASGKTDAGNDNDKSVTITINDSGLKTKIDAMDANHGAEVTARKNADSLLAGTGWDTTNATWKSEGAPAYTNITKLSEQITIAEGKIDALATATHFLGVFASLDEVSTPVAGDIVVIVSEDEYNGKEFIYDTTKGWIELGDVKDEVRRITALEAWVNGNAPISNADILKLFDKTEPEEPETPQD